MINNRAEAEKFDREGPEFDREAEFAQVTLYLLPVSSPRVGRASVHSSFDELVGKDEQRGRHRQ